MQSLLKNIVIFSFIIVSLLTKQSFQQEETTSSARTKNRIVRSPVVKAPAGNFSGQTLLSRAGKLYHEYRGIPYAEPTQRFEPSTLAKPIQGEYDARNHKSNCPQSIGPLVQGSEDCLYLSVAYPHENRCQNQTNPARLPVMFNIHGGSYSTGSGSWYGGSYLLDECVVYVSINYRLGAFGFLATDDGVIPGNLGLKDQVTALKWVRTNIASFRGDPDRVTIFGISANQPLASWHQPFCFFNDGVPSCFRLSKWATLGHHSTFLQFIQILIICMACAGVGIGLFHGAIAQSGNALDASAITKYPDRNAARLARTLNCSTASSTEMKECLKTKSVRDIISYSNEQTIGEINPFYPVIESSTAADPFQTQYPTKVFESGNFNKVPMITGFMKDEGISMNAQSILSNRTEVARINNNWNTVIPYLFYYEKWNISAEERDRISAKIRKFYFNDKPVGERTRQNLTNLCSDRYYVQSIFQTVQQISGFIPVYPYVNTYTKGLSFTLFKGYLKPAASHADDAQYLFPLLPLGSEQSGFSRNMISLWTSFATLGRPIGNEQTLDTWKPAEAGTSNENWFELNVPTRTISNYLPERRNFWKDLEFERYGAS